MRQVMLPLASADKCYVCSKTKDVRFCSRCAERIYCSKECQTSDWAAHKTECKNTERIELGTVYPFFAICVDNNRTGKHTPIHPALRHQIINSPAPGSLSLALPNGDTVKPIVLGDPIPPGDDANWWPSAPTPETCAKLARQILRDGHGLSAHFSMAIALVAEFYATPNEKSSKRLRLKYRTSPIADFGIAWGSARVGGQEMFFYRFKDGTILRGEDPKDHHWLYFTTARGEELTLDFGLFTFNNCFCVSSAQYLPDPNMVTCPFCPAFFCDREMQSSGPELYTERKRWSVLRDERIHAALRDCDVRIPAQPLWDIMDAMSVKVCKPSEKHLFGNWLGTNMTAIRLYMIQTEAWKKWPEEPTLAVEHDPGETDYTPEDEAWLKESIKERRKEYKKKKQEAKKSKK